MLAIQESVDAKYVKKPMCSVYNQSDLTFTYHERVQVTERIVRVIGFTGGNWGYRR